MKNKTEAETLMGLFGALEMSDLIVILSDLANDNDPRVTEACEFCEDIGNYSVFTVRLYGVIYTLDSRFGIVTFRKAD